MSETDVLEDGAVAETVLDRKKGRDSSLPPSCFACGAEVVGPFCYNCGQKNDDCRRNILSLAGETLTGVFSIDSKFFRTLGTMLTKPGRYVREYGDGKRSVFTPPIRFFLVISFVFFSIMALTDTYFLTLKPRLAEANEETGQVAAMFELQSGEVQTVTFDFLFLAKASEAEYTEDEAAAFKQFVSERVLYDIDETDEEDVLAAQEFSSVADRINQVALNPRPFNTALNSWLPRLMFIMAPLMAFLGLFFVRGKDALVYDHLILSLNVHAFMFLALIAAVFAASLVPGGVATSIFLVTLFVYYLLALKGAFRRGWIKSFFATLFVFFFYSLFMFSSLLIVSIIAIRDST
ncbi:MAG: DUF3667 domain-containing protein [Aquisalinus sp.]|nr:DUF3667 domain-containing protein [Aquisalinus sp.]